MIESEILKWALVNIWRGFFEIFFKAQFKTRFKFSFESILKISCKNITNAKVIMTQKSKLTYAQLYHLAIYENQHESNYKSINPRQYLVQQYQSNNVGSIRNYCHKLAKS